METMLGIFAAIGLSAACGLRVFIPLLIASIASMSGHLTLSSGFEWIGTYPALVAFATATCLEIAVYYSTVLSLGLFSWLENIMDIIATPAAIVAGALLMATYVSDFSPFLKWTLIIIAGGGGAATFQGATVLVRGLSTGTTGGLGNPVVSTAEAGGSIVLSILAITLPIIAFIIVLIVLYFVIRKMLKKLLHLKKA